KVGAKPLVPFSQGALARKKWLQGGESLRVELVRTPRIDHIVKGRRLLVERHSDAVQHVHAGDKSVQLLREEAMAQLGHPVGSIWKGLVERRTNGPRFGPNVGERR